MQKDSDKTKEQLIAEIEHLRNVIAEIDKYHAIIQGVSNAIPHVVTLVDEDCVFLDVIFGNSKFCTREQKIEKGIPVSAVFPKAASKAITKAIQESVKTALPKLVEFSIDPESGTGWTEGRISPPNFNAKTGKNNFIMVLRDIDDRKQAEVTLNERETTYRTVVENIPERVIFKDTNHVVVSCNSLFAASIGKTPAEIIGLHTRDLYEPDLANMLIDTDDLVARTNEPYTFTHNINIDGQDLVFQSVKTPVKDDKDNLIGTLSIIHDITERKRAEEALQLSDMALRSIKECVFATDVEFNVTYWNRFCEEAIGISESEAIGKNLGELFDMAEDYPEQNVERISYLVEHGSNHEEQLYITPKGEIWMDVFAQAIERDGERYGWITLASDITERKKVEESLRISEERFSKAFRAVPDGITIMRMEDSIYLEVNDSYCTISGFTRDEVIGRSSLDLNVWIDMRERDKLRTVMLQQGYIKDFRHQFRKKNGETGVALINSESIDIAGIPCSISIITDITEKVQNEEQLQYQASLVDNVAEAIISHDENLNILSWNKGAENLFQITKEDIIGNDIRTVCDIETINTTVDDIKKALDETGFWRGEAIHHIKNGPSLHMRVSTMVVNNVIRGDTSYVLIMTDITEEKKAEKELQQLYEREKSLRQELENEMKKRTEFSAAIVHELKTPLTAIVSSSELLSEEAVDPALLRLVRNINRSAYVLDKRTNELLDMTRGELGILEITPEKLDLLDIIRSMEIQFTTLLSGKNIDLTLDLPDQLPAINGDEGRIRQIFYNIISNAEKYTGNDGSVKISVIADETEALVEIHDTGIGLSAIEKQYIFEPYRQLIDGKRAKGGMGLGLAISRNILQAHGGKIWVESRKGQGSSFFLTIPYAKDE